MNEPTGTSTDRPSDDPSVHAFLEGSRLYRFQERIHRELAALVPDIDPAGGSLLVRLGTRNWSAFERIVRASYLYWWLTAEPEPEVIVIDHRETYTVAPVIALLDWLIGGLRRAAGGSEFVEASRRLGHEFTETPIRLTGIGLVIVSATWLLLALVEGSTTWMAVAGVGTLVGVLATRERQSLEEVQDTRAYKLLAAAFEPPEPPEDERE
ncbi:MAG: hypothetical protein ACOCQ3_05290 [Natronomonas sp.]